MRRSDFLRLLGLASIWGASFLFMRIIAPQLGALWTAEIRVGLCCFFAASPLSRCWIPTNTDW